MDERYARLLPSSSSGDVAVPALGPLLDPIKREMKRISDLKERDETMLVIKQHINRLGNDELEAILDVMGTSSGNHSEDRLVKLVPLLWGTYNDLENAKNEITKTQKSMETFFPQPLRRGIQQVPRG